MNQFKKIKNSKYGSLFKLKYSRKLSLQNISTFFGIEKNYNKCIIKWSLNNFDKLLIEDMENDILNIFNTENNTQLEIKSKLDLRKNYKPMLISSLDKKIHDILEHQDGDLIDNDSLIKNKNYNVDFIVNYVSVNKNKMHVKLEINKIKCVN